MNIRRYYVPDAIIFITQVVDYRLPVFQDEANVELLKTTLRNVKELHPFTMLGYVLLPDHFHLLIRPTGASNFSQIMHSLKPNFTKAYKAMIDVTGPMKFWQKSFWDHVIRDVADLEHHLDYMHYNPVRHQLVIRPEDWPHSSFLLWKRRGLYPEEWGWTAPDTIQGAEWDVVERDDSTL